MAEARRGGAERVEIVSETDRLDDPFIALIVRVGGTLELVRNPRWGDLALRHARHHAEHGFVGAGLRCSIGGACGYPRREPYPPDEAVGSTVT